jgi:hypothetical protein
MSGYEAPPSEMPIWERRGFLEIGFLLSTLVLPALFRLL